MDGAAFEGAEEVEACRHVLWQHGRQEPARVRVRKRVMGVVRSRKLHDLDMVGPLPCSIGGLRLCRGLVDLQRHLELDAIAVPLRIGQRPLPVASEGMAGVARLGEGAKAVVAGSQNAALAEWKRGGAPFVGDGAGVIGEDRSRVGGEHGGRRGDVKQAM